MPFTHQALASVWLIVFGLFALSASGTITGSGVVLLVVASLVAPAILLTFGPKHWRVADAAVPVEMGALAASHARDRRDLRRMDGDKG